MISRLISDNYFKNISKLFVSNSLSQALSILLLPILARVYSPELFGVYGNFVAIVTLFSVFMNLKYDVAIVFAKTDQKANVLQIIALVTSFAFLIFFSLVLLLNPEKLLSVELKSEEFKFFIPLTGLLLALYSANIFKLNRLEDYNQIAFNRIAYVIILNGLSLSFYFLLPVKYGLVTAFILTYLLLDAFLLIKYKPSLKGVSKLGMVAVMKEFKEYPYFTLPSSLLATFVNKLPLLSFALLFGETAAGLYFLVDKVLMAPIDLVGKAVGMGYRKEAQNLKSDSGSYRKLYIKTLKLLAVISVPFFLIVGIFGKPIFEIAFGSEWREAGFFAQILSMAFLFKFIAAPLISGMFVSQKQKENFYYQAFYTILVLLSFGVGAYTESLENTLVLFSVSGVIFHVFILIKCYQLSSVKT